MESSCRRALLCVAWIVVATGMSVVNKKLQMTFQEPLLISMFQLIVAVVVIGPFSLKSLMRIDARQLRFWLIVPLLFAGRIASNAYTFVYLTLSLLAVIQNLLPLFTLPIEILTMPKDQKPQVTFGMVFALLITLTGGLVYAGGIQGISVVGMIAAIANLFLMATDRILQRRFLTTECKDITTQACIVLNNSIGFICLLVIAAPSGELQKVNDEEVANWLEPIAAVLLVISGLVGIGICYVGLECQRVMSTTSFFVLQSATKVFVVTSGIVIFGDPIDSASQVCGLLLSLSGSMLYAKTQTSQNHEIDNTESQDITESKKHLRPPPSDRSARNADLEAAVKSDRADDLPVLLGGNTSWKPVSAVDLKSNVAKSATAANGWSTIPSTLATLGEPVPAAQPHGGTDPITQLIGRTEPINFGLTSMEATRRFRAWIPRATDIIITTFPKTGATWVQQICEMLRCDAAGLDEAEAMNFEAIEQVQPFVEYAYDLGQDLDAQQRGGLQPRLFKSHTALSRSPGRFCAEAAGNHDCKYIVTVREPAIALVSWFNFQQQKGENAETSNHMGKGTNRCQSPDDLFEQYGWPVMSGNTLWETYLEFWRCRHQPNVLLLAYEDIIAQPGRSVERIATFMGIGADQGRVARVLARSTKGFMGEHASKFDESWVREAQIQYGRTPVLVNPASRITGGATSKDLKLETIERIDKQWKTEIASVTGLETYTSLLAQLREEAAQELTVM